MLLLILKDFLFQQIVRQTEEKKYVELAWCPPTEEVIPECRLERVSGALSFMKLATQTTLGTYVIYSFFLFQNLSNRQTTT